MASTQLPQGVTPETCQTNFEHGVALALSLWPALNLAVHNGWGGPSSADKRDWFAGAVVELFADRPDTDLEDVETVLLQVMLDEFEVNVDDESAYDVAQQVMELRKKCGEGDFAEVEKLRERWNMRSFKPGPQVGFHRVEKGEDEDETDWDSNEDDDDDDDEDDVEMGDAPAPVEREKYVPEVDEDGFTKVVSKKKR